MDNVLEKFEFSGFEPDGKLKGRISRVLDTILGTAPSDAVPVAILRKTATGFEALLKLNSLQGIFQAQVTCADAADAVDRLKDKISEQIGRWQARRYATPTLRYV